MNWNEIIADLEEKLAASEEQAVRLRRFLEEARVLAKMYGGATPSSRGPAQEAANSVENVDGPSRSEVRKWRKLTRGAAIKRVLADAPGPMSPAQIRDRLEAHGRQGDAPKYVSSELHHLREREEVARLGRGEWALADPTFRADERIGDLRGVPRPDGVGLPAESKQIRMG